MKFRTGTIESALILLAIPRGPVRNYGTFSLADGVVLHFFHLFHDARNNAAIRVFHPNFCPKTEKKFGPTYGCSSWTVDATSLEDVEAMGRNVHVPSNVCASTEGNRVSEEEDSIVGCSGAEAEFW